MLRVFEAFAGYGSQRMALRNLGIEHEVVAISEFDKYADASYQAIHGETWNMDDITKIDVDDVPDHDLFTYSFPCQDISVAGKGKGFSKDSGTRSGLLWESERIIKAKKPKYLLMENVKNLISEKFMPGFVEWILALEELGYSNYYEVLNAKDFGIPQNRERVFMVSILGKHEPYVFPKPIKLEKRLKDVLEEEVDEKYYLDNERTQQLIATITDVNSFEQQEGLKMNRNEVSGKSDIAQTLLARDYKGFGNQDMNGVIEPERILGIFDKENSTHQSGSVYNKEKIAPTLDTMQGGWRQPSIIDEPKVNKVDITQKVMVRKHKVDTGKLVQTLRNHKKITNREIAEKLDRPITQVEHWFRTDDSFSIPNPDIWYELKEMLEIKTDEFDKPITEFIEEDGVYEKAERHYFTDGIAPTLTSASADEKIIEQRPIIAASRGRGKNNEQQLEVNKDETSNALTTVEKDNYVVEPLGTLASGASEQFGVGYMDGLSKTLKANKHDISVLEGVDVHPFSKKLEFQGYKQKDVSPCLLATDYKAPKTVLEKEYIGTLASGSSEQFGVGYMEGLSKTLKANKHDISVLEGIPIINNTKKGYLLATEGDGVDLAYAKQGKRRGRVQKDMAQTLTADDSKGVVEKIDSDDVIGTLYSGASKEFQGGVLTNLSRTLKANNHDTSVTDGYRIRKLTPLECWRLMDVTDEDFYKAQAVNSNSQLYKQAGNSIVVSVLEAIFRNMFLEVPEEDLVGEHIPLF